ncbi:MAG: SCO1664 family protein [Acidimicrobiales bacterium]
MPPDERPPASRRLTGWRPGQAGLEELTDLLATAPLAVEGRLPWSSNLSLLVTVEAPRPDDATAALHAVYKPGRGERPLWDFPDGLYRREVAAAVLSDALGWGLVPPTVLRHDGPLGSGSVQLFVDADYEEHYFTLVETGKHDAALRAICAFDIVANNADRKSGHVLLGAGGRLWAIDHGLCFHEAPKLRTVIWDFAGDPVPAHLLDDLAALVDDLPGELTRLLAPAERTAVARRAADLVETGCFPEPAGERPPYPWPLI